MIIKFDRSYISAGTRELIERGYAREELDIMAGKDGLYWSKTAFSL